MINPTVTQLVTSNKKLDILLVFITQCYFAEPKID